MFVKFDIHFKCRSSFDEKRMSACPVQGSRLSRRRSDSFEEVFTSLRITSQILCIFSTNIMNTESSSLISYLERYSANIFKKEIVV